MQTTAYPAAVAVYPSNSLAIAFGRAASATLFALAALAMLVFTLQERANFFHYHTSVVLRMPQLPSAADAGEQMQSNLWNDAGLSSSALIARWKPFIAEASQRFAIPEQWIEAVMRVESGGRTMLAGQPITSSAGAAGLMQLMRDTYGEMRDRYQLGSDIYNPRDNIMAGAAYLQQLRNRYGYPYMFAAYNAGPGRVDEHLQRGKSLPRETRNYIVLVAQFLGLGIPSAAAAEPRVIPRPKPQLRGGKRVSHVYLALNAPRGMTNRN